MASIIVPDRLDECGRFTIVTRELASDGTFGPPHRAPVEPGHWEGGVWVATAVDELPVEVRDLATALWTSEVVNRFKERFPWVPVAAPEI